MVNKIDYKPPFLFDSWAIPNIQKSFDRVRGFMTEDDQQMVAQVVSHYQSIPIDTLPHAFVHGDFTKTNVMKSGVHVFKN